MQSKSDIHMNTRWTKCHPYN